MLDIFSINIYISRSGRTIVKLYLRRLTGDSVSVFQYYIRSHIPTLSLALHLVLVGCPAARTNVSRHLCLHIFLLCGHYPGSRLTWSWWLDPEIFSDLTLPVTMICFVWRNHLVRAESCYPGESQSRTETGGKRAWLHPSLTLITDARPSLWSDLGNADDDVFSSQLFNPGIF